MKNNRADEYREYEVGEQYEWGSHVFHSDRKVQRGGKFQQLSRLHVLTAFKRLLQGIGRLLVVARYGLSGLDLKRPAMKLGIQLSWWKLALAALALFILLKKDIHFSVNMKSPAGAGLIDDDSGDADPVIEEFGLVQTAGLIAPDHQKLPRLKDLDDAQVREYIHQFGDLAISEMMKFDIPASITMAQAILESRAGQHPATRAHNNHFGKPLHGHTFKNDWENWREHSLLLFHEFPTLFELEGDYKEWARQLTKLGYNADRRYGDKLVEVIKKYQLNQLDKQVD